MAWFRLRVGEASANLHFIAGLLLGISLTLVVQHYGSLADGLKLLILMVFLGLGIFLLLIPILAQLRQQQGASFAYDGTKQLVGEVSDASSAQPGRPVADSRGSSDNSRQKSDNAERPTQREQRRVTYADRSSRPPAPPGETSSSYQKSRQGGASTPHSRDSADISHGPSPDILIEVWDRYWREGDGHFTASGLSKQLERHGVQGKVIPGSELGVADNLLGVVLESREEVIYILPNFNKSPKAVVEWFNDRGSGSLAARITRVDQLAIGHRGGNGELRIDMKGIVG